MPAQSQVSIRADLSALRKDLAASAGLTEDQAKGMIISLEKRLKAAEKASKAAAKANRDVAKATEAAARAAAESAKNAEKNASAWGAVAKKIQQSTLVSEMETIAALGIQAGGSVSRLASVVTSLIRPVAIATGVLGPMALMIGGTVAGLAALPMVGAAVVHRLDSLGESAGESGERLRKLGLLTGDAANFVHEMEKITEAAAIATDKWTVTLARATPEVTTARLALVGFREEMTEHAEAVAKARERSERLNAETKSIETNFSGAGLVVAAAASAMGLFAEKGEEAVKVANEAAAMKLPFVGPIDDRNTLEGRKRRQKEADAAQRKAEAAARKEAENARVVNDALRERNQARSQLAAIEEQANARALTDEAKIQAEYEARVAQIRELAKTSVELDRVDAAMAAAEAARIRELAALDDKRAKAAEKAAAKQAAADQKLQTGIQNTIRGLEGVGRAMEAFRKDWIAKIRDAVVSLVVDTTQQVLGTITQLAQMELDNDLEVLDKRREAVEKFTARRKELREQLTQAETDGQRAEIEEDLEKTKARINNAKNAEAMAHNAALKQFRDIKKLQVAQTILNAAAAGAMTLAVTPLPPPFNIAAAAITSGAALSELAVIRKTQPSFHTGGVVRGDGRDEVPTTALDGEGYVSRRGMGGIGEKGLQELNETGRLGGGDWVINNVTKVDGRVLARSTERRKRGRSRRNIHAERG